MNITIRNTKAASAVSPCLKGKLALRVLGAVAGVTVLAQSAYADISVCASGCDQTSIQAAIDIAPDGGVIRIRSGVYEERLVITNKGLRLAGDGSAVTVIDGKSIDTGARVLSLNCVSAKKTAIDGVTITGGVPKSSPSGFPLGGGGLENLGCKVTLDNSLVTGNAARAAGGIDNQGTMTIWNSVVSNNTAIDLDGGGISNSGILEVTKSQIFDNYALTYGGGIANSGTLTGSNVTIAHNNAAAGGGIVNTGSGSLTDYRILNNESRGTSLGGGGVYNLAKLTIKYSLLLANTSALQGGGIYNRAGGNLKLVGSFVTRNGADVTGSGGSGGGLFNAGGTVSLTEGTAIVNNTPNNCNDTTCP